MLNVERVISTITMTAIGSPIAMIKYFVRTVESRYGIMSDSSPQKKPRLNGLPSATRSTATIITERNANLITEAEMKVNKLNESVFEDSASLKTKEFQLTEE